MRSCCMRNTLMPLVGLALSARLGGALPVIAALGKAARSMATMEFDPAKSGGDAMRSRLHAAADGQNDAARESWTAHRLQTMLKGELDGAEVIVVSNREPYIHVRTAAGVRLQRPASGLVTALEPVM